MKQMQKPTVEPVLISRRATGGVIGVSIRTVDALIARHELKTRRIGRRRLVIVSSIREFARRDVCSIQPGPTTRVLAARTTS